ncbi:PDDEXK nuclease domain-containing protein [Thiomicrospira microaerophila]|uniref:PDDEXK nuclease domain-containing protein n=1 Tax=Thiomicrospira microaerophila TaxID=406020 RepID=UPI00389A9D9F
MKPSSCLMKIHPIGIIICKDKKRTTVEFAPKESNQPIGVATYTLAHQLPKEYQHALPPAHEIEQKLSALFAKETTKPTEP